MYLFPDALRMEEPGAIKRFISDLHTGKLHREFHYGPDPTQDNELKATSPPESTFKKLAPSSNRYTILRDEL
jgi:endoplasmic reticulum resident protein 44